MRFFSSPVFWCCLETLRAVVCWWQHPPSATSSGRHSLELPFPKLELRAGTSWVCPPHQGMGLCCSSDNPSYPCTSKSNLPWDEGRVGLGSPIHASRSLAIPEGLWSPTSISSSLPHFSNYFFGEEFIDGEWRRSCWFKVFLNFINFFEIFKRFFLNVLLIWFICWLV